MAQVNNLEIVVLSPCLVNGRHVDVGKSWHAPYQEAMQLINAGKAKEVHKLNSEEKRVLQEQEARLKKGEGAMPSPSVVSETATFGVSYELMTLAQLKDKATRRGVAFGSREPKEKLIELLKAVDAALEGGV